jgi:hypothetical protein
MRPRNKIGTKGPNNDMARRSRSPLTDDVAGSGNNRTTAGVTSNTSAGHAGRFKETNNTKTPVKIATTVSPFHPRGFKAPLV